MNHASGVNTAQHISSHPVHAEGGDARARHILSRATGIVLGMASVSFAGGLASVGVARKVLPEAP